MQAYIDRDLQDQMNEANMSTLGLLLKSASVFNKNNFISEE